MSATNNPLSSLSKEQLDALLDVLRKQTKPSHDPTPIPTPSVFALPYYKISDGLFETIVEERDLIQPSSREGAWMYARVNVLQPWYFIGTPHALNYHNNGFVEKLTREEYIAWLRR